MTAFTDRICDALENLLRSRSEWDEAPDVHFLYAEDGRMRLSDPEALTFAEQALLRRLAVPSLVLPVKEVQPEQVVASR